MTNTNNDWDKLFEQLPLDATPSEEHRAELRARVLEQFDHQPPSPVAETRINYIGRIMMKYKVPHWTAAAAVLIVCAVWFTQSDTPAIAAEDVVAHITKAKTAQWDMIVKNEGSADVKIRVYLAPGHSRQELDSGMVSIVDWNQGQMLGLFADQKLAMRMSTVKSPGSGMEDDVFEKMRDDLREAMTDEDKKVEELGQQQVDGRPLVGFRFKPDTRTITIWADPNTGFPVRMEMDISGPRKSTVVMENYQFNKEIDPSLFSLEVPPGYSVMEESEIEALKQR